MREFSVMIKPASSLCNLRCKYCFYEDVSRQREIQSYGVMSRETVVSLLRNVFSEMNDDDRVRFEFQGGEPTVAGPDFFRFFVDEVEKYRGATEVGYSIQTNGTLLNEEWCEFLRDNKFLTGLSIDGGAGYHNANRVMPDGSGTFSKVTEARKMLEKYGVEYNVLTVLTNSLARHPAELWNFVKKQGIKYIQLIPCLGELGETEKTVYELTPERFASFYTRLFDLWFADFRREQYTSIKLFDDIVNLLAWGQQNACGICGKCSPQAVVEADGSVYPCDFHVLDTWKLGNITETGLVTLLTSPKMAEFLNRGTEKPKACDTCPYVEVCGGGCPRMRGEVCAGAGDTGCGYRSFLDGRMPMLRQIAMQQRVLKSRMDGSTT